MTNSVTIRGVTYRTQSDAAIALGVSKATVSAANKAGTLDHVGQGPRRGKGNDKAITIRGVTYRTQSDAAIALGVTSVEISAYVKVSRILGE